MEARRPAVGPLLLAAVLVLSSAAACVTIAPSGDVTGSGAVTAKPVADVDASIDPTVGPERTKKPRRPRNQTPAPAATAAPTSAPTDAPAPTVMDTPPAATLDPNATPFCCLTFRLPPIDLPSGLVFEPFDTELDYTRAPNYGAASLATGFTPDPYSVGMTVGGPINVSYLGSSCAGFATVAPDLRINRSGGGALLRLYFISGSGDTTMVVNDPFGNFYCVDDSFGTVNPTIDFNNPANGSYDVWVGSYASGTTVSGTFYVTENSGNHP